MLKGLCKLYRDSSQMCHLEKPYPFGIKLYFDIATICLIYFLYVLGHLFKWYLMVSSIVQRPLHKDHTCCGLYCTNIHRVCSYNHHILKIYTSPSSVFSILPFTTRACSGSLSLIKCAVTIGVLIVFEALMISLIRGTPRVIFVNQLRLKILTISFQKLDAHYSMEYNGTLSIL